MSGAVVIVDYDDCWPERFEREKSAIERVFRGTDAAIVHVGSTAVKGLGAKPIIDIMAGLSTLVEAETRIGELAGLGYEYVPEFEAELPERRYFRKPPNGRRDYHLHCVVRDSVFWKRELAFRDYLRRHPEEAAAYFALKKELAARFGHDRAGYTQAKGPFIESILRKANG